MSLPRNRGRTRHAGLVALVLLVGLGTALPVAEAQSREDDGLRDVWLHSRLIAAYALNPHLGLRDLDVAVTDGVATVSGQVESPVEHDLALEIAKGVDGIRRVDNRIRVRPSAAARAEAPASAGGEEGEPDFAGSVWDATLTASVKMRLMWNRHTDGLDITVTTHRGEVTLEGRVDDPVTRDLAGQIAANTDGVRGVDNRLRVVRRPGTTVGERLGGAFDTAGEMLSDAWITTRVYARLDASEEIDSLGVRVTTQDGRVTLTGKVGSDREHSRVPEIAGTVTGVRGIDNQLEVEERISQQSS